MEQVIHHVMQRPDGKWAGKRTGIGRANALTGTREEALRRTQERAQKEGAGDRPWPRKFDQGRAAYPRLNDPTRFPG